MQYRDHYSLLFRFTCRVIKCSLFVAFGLSAVFVLSVSFGNIGLAETLLTLLLPLLHKAFLCLFWLMAAVVLVESVR